MSKSQDGMNFGVDVDPDYLEENRPKKSVTRPSSASDKAPWIDRSEGSGSGSWSDDSIDANPRRPANDGRSSTETTFYADDVDGGSIDWGRLAKINDGVGSSDRSIQNHNADKERIVETLGSSLGCTTYQVEKASHTLETAGNLQERFPTRPMEEIALSALTLAIDADVNDFEHRATARDSVKELMQEVGVDGTSELFQIRRKLGGD